MRSAWLVAAALALAAVTGVQGYRLGGDACEAAHAAALARAQRELFEVAERVSAAEAARLDAERALDEAQKGLDDAAYSDPDAVGCGLSLDGVRRLRD